MEPLSASQIETWALCRRKWAWQKIAGLTAPSGAGAALGSDVHNALETYLTTGALPDQSTPVGEIATSGLHHLPPPQSQGLEVERDFSFSSPVGHVYRGRKDYVWRRPGLPVLVGDHKTTSDFKWSKDETILAHDTQALIYAAHELLATGDPAVNLEWVYYRTRGARKSKKVSLQILASDVESRFRVIDEKAAAIHADRRDVTEDTILDLPANLDACSAYGGCPFQYKCNVPLGRMMASYDNAQKGFDMSQPGTEDLMARLAAQAAGVPQPPPANPPPPNPLDVLRARQAAAVPAAPPPPPAAGVPAAPPPPPPPVPAAPPPPPAATAPAAPPPPPAVPAAPPPRGYPDLAPPGGTWYTRDGGNWYSCHCGQQQSDAMLAASSGACVRCHTPAVDFPAFAYAVNPPEQSAPPPPEAVPAAPLPPPAVPAAPPPPEAPKKRGRPVGSKNKPPAEAAPAAPPPPPAVPAAPPPPEAAPAEARIAIQCLYIGCAPDGGADSAETVLFAPARRMVAEVTGQADYRLIDYGKGPGLFAVAVADILSRTDLDALTVDPRSPDAQNVMTLLCEAAGYVVRSW